uniref:Uncharacterized protein n=1 Tax=Strigamia maritima TaxID=126957 RepID=T1J3A0_STRMM
MLRSGLHSNTRVLHPGGNIKPQISNNKKKKCKSIVHKILWFTSVFVSTALCIWQLSICLENYFRQPVGNTVRVEMFTQYTTPSLTLCPCNHETTFDFGETFRSICEQNEACNNASDRDNFPFDKLSITLLDLWEAKTNISYMEIKPEARCHYAVNRTQCNSNDWLKWRRVERISGPCMIFYSDMQWYYIGNLWSSWLIINNVPWLYKANVLASSSINVMFLGKADIFPFSYTIFKISETKFEYLNTNQNPCVTQDEEEVECINKWFNDRLQTFNIKCR